MNIFPLKSRSGTVLKRPQRKRGLGTNWAGGEVGSTCLLGLLFNHTSTPAPALSPPPPRPAQACMGLSSAHSLITGSHRCSCHPWTPAGVASHSPNAFPVTHILAASPGPRSTVAIFSSFLRSLLCHPTYKCFCSWGQELFLGLLMSCVGTIK